jgi:hypothetical protein
MPLITRDEIAKFVFTSLGYPIVTVELAPEQLQQCIDTAINDYLSNGAAEIAYAEIPNNNSVNNCFPLPEDVATVKNVVFNVPFQAAAAGTDDIFSFAVAASPLGPQYSSYLHASSNLAVFYEYLQNRNRIIGNDITFKVVNNQLYIWPYPKYSQSIIIEYSKNAYGIIDKDNDGISTSNSWGINWIRKRTLALAKGMLGKVRGKYTQVSGGPGNEGQQLNSQELTAESKEELQKLDEELLQRVSHVQFFIA